MRSFVRSSRLAYSSLTLVAVVAIVVLTSGCGKKAEDSAAHDHDHAHGPAHGESHAHGGAQAQGKHHGHAHVAPHGGTAVVLGDEAYHLEFVRDADAGTLTAYLLDGHMEQFVRSTERAFSVDASVDGRKETLVFNAVANAATGETVGDTSQFEAKAEWLKTTAAFQGRIVSVSVRGTPFENVAFRFPEGNER